MARSIVMVHGMWGGAWCWDSFRSFFEKRGYSCCIPTLRHHDVSPLDRPPAGLGTTSLLDYADDLETLIKKMPEKPIVMGHSMGGLLAQILAQNGGCSKTVLLAPAPPAGIYALSYSVLKCFLNMFLKWAFWRKPHKIPFERAVYAFLHQLTPAMQKAEYRRLVYESGRATSEIGLWPIDPNRASRVDENRITCPQLIVGAGNDRIVPVSVVRKIAKKYHATACYKEFKNHSHWLIGEQGWESVAGSVADWLENRS